MAQTMVNFRMDDKLKKDMEKTCKNMGLTLTSAFTMFAAKVVAEKRIPFNVEEKHEHDPYFEEQLKQVKQTIEELKTGKQKMSVHELIDID